MALYDWKCSTCDHEFEQFCKMDEREAFEKNEPCPKCGAKKLKQFLKGVPHISSGGLYKKHDGGFKEAIAKVAQNHPHHELDHLL